MLSGNADVTDDKKPDAPKEKKRRIRRPNPKNRQSPPLSEEDVEHRRVFYEIVDKGKMEDQFYTREPTDKEKGIIRSMVFAGITREKIAACVGMELHRLEYIFVKELDHGRELMVADIAYTLAARARAGSDTAAIYLLKVRGGPAFSEARATREAEKAGDEGSATPETLEQSEKEKLVGKIMNLIKIAQEEPAQAGAETK